MRTGWRYSALPALFWLALTATAPEAAADPTPPPAADVANDTIGAIAEDGYSSSPAPVPRQAGAAAKAVNYAKPAYNYRLTLACGYDRVSNVEGSSDVTNCTYALTACQYRTPPSDKPLYYLWRKAKEPANSPWVLQGEMCGTETAPEAAAPPPVPTMGQIQDAFKRLPFSKPTVRVEPKGNVTLVNLPTYYEATWPDDAGLQPGEVSAPVQLLSWSVEFKISSRSYNFHYGDGSSSGSVHDAGGSYPEGSIKHTYQQPDQAAAVSVDSQLTGQFRVNGGDWMDIDTVADLQNEPVTTLEVREAKARLYSN